MKVVFTRSAGSDVRRIFAYIEEHAGEYKASEIEEFRRN